MIKYLTYFISFSLSFISLSAQTPQLEVEVHTKIRGNIDINHQEDTTSVLIGRSAGAKLNFQFKKHNAIVGANAGRNNNSGSDNSFFGSQAGQNTLAEGNSFFGSFTGLNNTSGYENSFFGYESGKENGSGIRNAYFGFHAGLNYSSASNNTFVGSIAGSNGRGSKNTFIGALSGFQNNQDSLVKAIAIGYKAKVACSNCAIIGGTGADSVAVGIGVNSPTQVLDVNGNARFRTVDNLPPFGNPATALYMYDNGTLVLNSSDQRLKENVNPLQNVLQKLSDVHGWVQI